MPDEAPQRALAGKTALITGGARRIGREIALTLAAAGADVAITYKNSATEAAETVREIEAQGVSGLAVDCDVRSENSVQSAIQAVVAVSTGWIFWSTTQPFSLRVRWKTLHSQIGIQFLRPMRADRFLLLARLYLICGRLKGASLT